MVHNFFENACKALIYDISLRLSPLSAIYDQKFPVAIMNTGDEVFMSTMFTDDTDIKRALYQRVPRLTLDIGGLTINADQLTNPHVLAKFTDKVSSFKTPKRANMRRMPLELSVSAEAIFSNIFEFFQFSEILLMNTYKNNVFPFYYLDKLMYGSYSYQDSLDSESNSTLGFDAERRRRILPLTFAVELQYPAFDYYGVPDNAVFDGNGTGNGNLIPGHGSSLVSEGSVMNTLVHRIHPSGRLNIDSAVKTYIPSDAVIPPDIV